MNKHLERDYSLDIIRILACALVVLMHSPAPFSNASRIVVGGIYELTSPCIGLFFMVSGSILLPSELKMFDFYHRRLAKIVYPTLVWTIIYLILNQITLDDNQYLFKKILSIPFSPQGYGVLWFMYTIAGLYFITPIISPWLKEASKKEIQIVLLFWVITLFIPLLKNFLYFREDVTNILYYFTGYIGYFILGYYITKYQINLKNLYLFIIYALGFGVPICIRLFRFNQIDGQALWYLGPFVVAMTFSIFVYIGIKSKLKIYNFMDKHCYIRIIISNISSLSFGIYLMHIAIMRYLLWKQTWFIQIENNILQIIVCFILTFFLSYFLSYLISKTRISKYFIGV